MNITDPTTLAALTLLIGAFFTGVERIVRLLRQTSTAIAAGQDAQAKRGKVRDRKIGEIHILVNSRLLTALRLVVTLTKREAERSGTPENVSAYQEALAEFTQAEGANQVLEHASFQPTEPDETNAVDAETHAIALRAPLLPPRKETPHG